MVGTQWSCVIINRTAADWEPAAKWPRRKKGSVSAIDRRIAEWNWRSIKRTLTPSNSSGLLIRKRYRLYHEDTRRPSRWNRRNPKSVIRRRSSKRCDDEDLISESSGSWCREVCRWLEILQSLINHRIGQNVMETLILSTLRNFLRIIVRTEKDKRALAFIQFAEAH